MPASAQVPLQQLVESRREPMERSLSEVMRAVNEAADGSWINASEMKIRDTFADLRRLAFEKALQMRADAAEGAFSPGGRAAGRGGEAAAAQGA